MARPHPFATSPVNTDYLKDFNVPTEAAKQAFLEKLYIESGRTCGTFTGLYQQWIEEHYQQERPE